MFFGILILIIWCRTFSFAGKSMSLLCILISNLSNVAVPSPHGDFLVVILSFFVGKGTGPEIVIPDLLAISLIELQIPLIISMSVLFSLIRTFGIKIYLRNSLKMLRGNIYIGIS